MPRRARQKSESGIYHIMLRGINRQRIFEDDEDRKCFIETLQRYKEKSGYTIYAYCLMDNHIHLLMKEGAEPLGMVFKRIAGSYVYWYNWKYGRSGHLFQDRFKSEPVEDDAYFITVLRYIHQNPVKANICQRAEHYEYSSFNEYVTQAIYVDTSLALSLMTKEQFLKFHLEESNDTCLELEDPLRLTDREAKGIIASLTNCSSSAEFLALDKGTRNLHIKRLYSLGLSIRQINRLTGVTKKIVEMNIE